MAPGTDRPRAYGLDGRPRPAGEDAGPRQAAEVAMVVGGGGGGGRVLAAGLGLPPPPSHACLARGVGLLLAALEGQAAQGPQGSVVTSGLLLGRWQWRLRPLEPR